MADTRQRRRAHDVASTQRSALRRGDRDDGGVSAEYVLLVLLIAVAVVGGVAALGAGVLSLFEPASKIFD